ncbi:MAG: hypothetical protein QM817_27430 [Archangium sp.]
MASHRFVLFALMSFACGCAREPSGVASSSPPNFELTCRSSNTATAAELFCLRTDTRSGDVVRVKHQPIGYGAIQQSTGDMPMSLNAYFTGLAAGTHTVSLFLRGGGGTCSDNSGNFSDLMMYVVEQ